MERGQFGWDHEENEYDEIALMQSSRSHVIFLIDASMGMQKIEMGCKLSPFQATIKYLVDYLTTKVNNGDSDEIAIIFYGTEQSRSSNSIPNIFVFHSIDKPDIEQIFKLQKILEANEFDKVIGSSEIFSLFDALSECAIILKRSSKKVKRFVYLITNEDDPCQGDAVAFSKTILKAQDLVPLPISLEIFGINRNGQFSYEKFYHKLTYFTYLDEDEQEFMALSSENDYHDLQSIFKSKEYSKRSAFSLLFKIGTSLAIGVKGYNLLMEKKKSSYVYVDRVSGDPVSSKPVYLSEKSGKLLKDCDYYYEIGGEKVLFSKEEIAEIKSGGTPGLQLLGFRDNGDLKIKFNIKRPIFIVPDDTRVKGSSSFFAHFLEGVYERKKIAICSIVTRKGAAMKIVALVPQIPSFDVKRESEIAAGFHLIFLPFSNELRAVHCPALEAKQESIEAAISLIENASVDYDLENISNPALNRHFSVLKNIALNANNQESTSDDTIPNYASIFEYSAKSIKEFNNSIANVVSDEVITLKRPTIKSGAGPKKKVKSETSPDLSIDDIKAFIESGSLKKLTVDRLVGFLASQNEKVKSKKKADLLAQAEAFIERQV